VRGASARGAPGARGALAILRAGHPPGTARPGPRPDGPRARDLPPGRARRPAAALRAATGRRPPARGWCRDALDHSAPRPPRATGAAVHTLRRAPLRRPGGCR